MLKDQLPYVNKSGGREKLAALGNLPKRDLISVETPSRRSLYEVEWRRLPGFSFELE